MIKAGQLLHLDFTSIYKLGRLGNLLLYCAVMFLAIRRIPFGKRIMLVLCTDADRHVFCSDLHV